MSERCHYIIDRDVGRILIPGCMGSAVYGIDGCTCPTVGEGASQSAKDAASQVVKAAPVRDGFIEFIQQVCECLSDHIDWHRDEMEAQQ